MSLEIKMTNEEISKLNYSKIDYLFTTHSKHFFAEKYFLERYSRSEEIERMIYTTDLKEMDVIVAQESQIIDTATGYGIGKPATYYDKADSNIKLENKKNILTGLDNIKIKKEEDKNKNEFIEDLLEVYESPSNAIAKHDIELLKQMLITGTGDEMIYTSVDDDDEISIEVALVKDRCIAIMDQSIKPRLVGFIRELVTMDPYSNTQSEVSYELYTNEKTVLFTNSGEYPLNFGGKSEIGNIPFVHYNIGQSYISLIVSGIRAYELVTNNTKRILNYNDESVLVLSGYSFTENKEAEVEEFVKTLKEKGFIFLDGEENTFVKWLEKNIQDGPNENHKANLKNDIYGIAGTFNSDNDNMVYQNTLSLMFKLYGLETKMSLYVEELRKGFIKRSKFVVKLINVIKSKNYNYKNLGIIFTRNLPTNTNEELNFMNQTKDLLSLHTIYENLSFISNPEKEVKKYTEWQLEKAKIDKEKNDIYSEGDEMVADTHENNGIEVPEKDDKKIETQEE